MGGPPRNMSTKYRVFLPPFRTLPYKAPFIATAAIGVLFACLLLSWGPPGSWGVCTIMLAGGVDLILLRHWCR